MDRSIDVLEDGRRVEKTPSQKAAEIAGQRAMADAALIAWAEADAAPHATGESTDPNGLKNEIAKRVELIMSVMPGDWPRRIRDDREIRGIFEANPCVPATTAQIAKQAAAEYVVTPRVRRWALQQISHGIQRVCAPEMAAGRLSLGEVRIDGIKASMDIISPLGRSTLSIDERDQLLLRRDGETESYVVRNLQELADATGILDTPGEHLKHVPHAETLSLKRDEWTRAVDAWTQDETARLVAAVQELRAVAPKAKPSDTGTHPDIGVVYSEMRAAWGSESLPAGHPMRIGDLGKFVEFVSLESLLFWGRRHVFGPLVSAGTAMGKATKNSKMLTGVVEEFGLQEYVRPQRSRWSRILDSLRGGSRAWSDRQYESYALATMHLTKLFAGFAPSARAYGSASRLRAKQGSYGTALVAEPINRHVEETLDSTISYLSSLYDSDETLGAIDSTNVKLPRLGRARTLEVDGRPIRSALRPATASVKDAINAPIWRPEMNTDGAGRIGATDFCLLMILQAYEAREPSSQWWQRIVALAEEAGRKRPDQGGTHMLERHSLRGAVKFF